MDGALLAVVGTIFGTTIGAMYSLRSARLAARAALEASRIQAAVGSEVAKRTTATQIEITERQLKSQRHTQIQFFHVQRRVEVYAKAGVHVETWLRWVRTTFGYREAFGNYHYKDENFILGTEGPPSSAMGVDDEAMFKLYASPELWRVTDDLRRTFVSIVIMWRGSDAKLIVGPALNAMEDRISRFNAYAQRDLNPGDPEGRFDVESIAAEWRTKNIDDPGVSLP